MARLVQSFQLESNGLINDSYGAVHSLKSRILAGESVDVIVLTDALIDVMDAGIIATSSSPEGFAAYIRVETAKWGRVIRDANIKGD